MVPTVYTFDSSEFVTGAWTLGFVHSPGYPLYTLLLHLFTRIPVAEPALLGNLFSAICLSLCAPLLYGIIQSLTRADKLAVTCALIFPWTYYVWITGLFAEIYAPQLLTIAACLFLILRLPEREGSAYWLAAALGVMLAIHPVSSLLLPGFVYAIWKLRRKTLWYAGFVVAAAGFLAALTYLYLPIRYFAHPEFSLLGTYNRFGQFEHVDLHTLQGIWWVVSGRQFGVLFFRNGLLPSWQQFWDTLVFFWGNFLGVGLVLGALGLWRMFVSRRQLFVVWLISFFPYTYFYLTYGALDRHTMFGPSYLLWMIPLAFGLQLLLAGVSRRWRLGLLAGLPLLFLVVNYPLADLSQETSIRQRTEAVMQAVPEDVNIIAQWADISPLEYMQYVEGQRQDIHLYNTFMFSDEDLLTFVQQLLQQNRQVMVVGREMTLVLPPYEFEYEPVPVRAEGIQDLFVFELHQR